METKEEKQEKERLENLKKELLNMVSIEEAEKLLKYY